MSGRLIASADIATATGSGRTVTASAPLLDLSQTWNNAGVTFTGLKFNVTDTASASGSLLMDLQKDGVTYFSVGRNNQVYGSTLRAAAGGLLAFTGRSQWSSPADGSMQLSNTAVTSYAVLAVDAANVLALRNGTSAQAFNVYNTYTDASNYERGYARWNAGVYEFGMEALGTGATKHVRLNRATGANLYLGDWIDNSSGHFLASVDNTYDIGASGANRPRRIYAAGFVVTQSTTVAGLTAAATAGAGARSFVTDATATTFLSVVAGGGANKVPVVSDGTNWLIG